MQVATQLALQQIFLCLLIQHKIYHFVCMWVTVCEGLAVIVGLRMAPSKP
jgi:hypothetical protein